MYIKENMTNTFDKKFEEAIKSILDESIIDYGKDKNSIKSNLKKTVRLIIHSKLDLIINKLIP